LRPIRGSIQPRQTHPNPVKSDDPTRENEGVHERDPGQEDDAQDHPDEICELKLPAAGYLGSDRHDLSFNLHLL
jgi:hypothetical protein